MHYSWTGSAIIIAAAIIAGGIMATSAEPKSFDMGLLIMALGGIAAALYWIILGITSTMTRD